LLYAYKEETKVSGIVYLGIAAASALLALLLTLCNACPNSSKGLLKCRVYFKVYGCQKIMLFIFGMSLAFVFFSLLIFGSSIYLVSVSTESYLQQYCEPAAGTNQVTIRYDSML